MFPRQKYVKISNSTLNIETAGRSTNIGTKKIINIYETEKKKLDMDILGVNKTR